MDSAHDSTGVLLSALRFAALKHRFQQRKGNKEPYINHPIEVTDTLHRLAGISDADTLAAALLHDTIEDTDTQPEEIRRLFGDRVLALVLELTDDKTLPQHVRKQLQIDNAPDYTTAAKLIRLADKLCNVRDIGQSLPAGWSVDRGLEYLDWAATVVQRLRGCNQPLERSFDEALQASRAALRRTLAPDD